ncbi:hypothetical protein ACL02O_05195 [Micromonospora sp. MS34]|uniref:hypothetical protein n=1 Tax=Micromonospora sp. MS34 TaxID=3385971 RepID=UPI0039A1D4DE
MPVIATVEDPVSDYPKAIAMVDRTEAVPRRIRAFLAGEPVLDTTRARYASLVTATR